MTLVQSLPAPAHTVALYGYGQVGRALIDRLAGVDVPLASIHDSSGVRARLVQNGAETILVDATAPRYDGASAEEWISTLEAALKSGTHVVTCNKAPLALAWQRLSRAAEAGTATLACSATVGGGTPLLLFLRRLHDLHGLVRVEACLSGTLSYVLHRLTLGDSLPAAVLQAQRAGLAEPDPTLDLNGTDAYAKALIIHNRLFPDHEIRPLDKQEPPLELLEENVRTILARGLIPQVVATITPGSVRLALEARTTETALLELPGNASVAAQTSHGQVFRLAGPGAGPDVTAGSLLGDITAIASGTARAGVWP